LEDFKEVLDLAHSLGIRVVMDMVLNHSSDQHRWFREARKSKDNPYRNYYIWHPPKDDGSEPNNWGNVFHEGNGSAWTFDEATGEYYFHIYSAKMPDLNWEYEPLRREIYQMLHWWLDLGVDGFRLDVITRLKKMPGFPDTTMESTSKLDINGFVGDPSMYTHVPGIHEILYRQGILETTYCLNPEEVLSPGQAEEIDRIYRMYPWLTDDDFAKAYVEAHKSELA
jgi:glycosidase